MVTELMPRDADPDAGYSGIPLKRVGTAGEIAKAALFLTCDDSSYCTGADFVLDGGALAGIHFG
jgi:3alpha(or 20beta)-hydroxysteroid dehydrogenase